MAEFNKDQVEAFLEMNDAFNAIAKKYGLCAAEASSVALVEARWIMNTMVKSPYAEFIAENLSAANRAVNYMQRIIADPAIDEETEIKMLVAFGLTGDQWDRESITQIVRDRRRQVLDEPVEKWDIRDYDVDMRPGTE